MNDLEHHVRASLGELFPEQSEIALMTDVRARVRTRRRRRRLAAGFGTVIAVSIAVAALSSLRPPTHHSNVAVRKHPQAGVPHVAELCAAVLYYEGQEYSGFALNERKGQGVVGLIPSAHRARIGLGRVPPCNDTNASPPSTSQTITVDRIEDFNPRAVISDQSGNVYLRLRRRIPSAAPTTEALKAMRSLEREDWIQWITA
jgi:hypothetical protein